MNILLDFIYIHERMQPSLLERDAGSFDNQIQSKMVVDSFNESVILLSL
jgi:hypothetical protein